jgi:hypothetical protein
MQVALQLATCSLHVSQAADLAATNQHVFEQIIMSQIARYLQQVTCQVHPEYPSITGAPLGIDSSLRPETLAFPLNQPNLLQTARSEEFHNLAGELFRVLVCARRPQPDGHSPTATARRPQPDGHTAGLRFAEARTNPNMLRFYSDGQRICAERAHVQAGFLVLTFRKWDRPMATAK